MCLAAALLRHGADEPAARRAAEAAAWARGWVCPGSPLLPPAPQQPGPRAAARLCRRVPSELRVMADGAVAFILHDGGFCSSLRSA